MNDELIEYILDTANDLGLQTEDNDSSLLDMLIVNGILNPELEQIIENPIFREYIGSVDDSDGDSELTANERRLQRRDERIKARVEKRMERISGTLEGERLQRRIDRLNRRIEKWEERKSRGGSAVGKFIFKLKGSLCGVKLKADKDKEENLLDKIKEVLNSELKDILTLAIGASNPLLGITIFVVSYALKELLDCKDV